MFVKTDQRCDVLQRYTAKAVGTLVGVAVAAMVAQAAPKPSASPKAWEIDFRFHDPQRMTLRLPGDDHETTYWYVLYTVVNRTDQEIPFFPTFHIVTSDLSVIEGGADISPSVYDAIKARHQKAYPFIMDQKQVFGPLLRGEDNARTSAIAFQRPSVQVNRFSLYVGGLSGEMVRVRNLGFDPNRDDKDDNPRFHTLRKTLFVDYNIPGDAKTRLETSPLRGRQDWVMR